LLPESKIAKRTLKDLGFLLLSPDTNRKFQEHNFNKARGKGSRKRKVNTAGADIPKKVRGTNLSDSAKAWLVWRYKNLLMAKTKPNKALPILLVDGAELKHLRGRRTKNGIKTVINKIMKGNISSGVQAELHNLENANSLVSVLCKQKMASQSKRRRTSNSLDSRQ